MDTRPEGFRSYIFQPEKVSINSFQDRCNDITTPYQQETYHTFKNKLKSPLLRIKSLELFRSTIPLPTTSIPNNECIFLYRKALNINGHPDFAALKLPSSLRFIRLLRTDFYSSNDPVFWDNGNPSRFGFNRIFADYQDLVNELNKAAQYDPIQSKPNALQYTANDISFQYDSQTQKISWKAMDESYYYTEVGFQDPQIPQYLASLENNLTKGEFTDCFQPLNVRLGFPWNGLYTDDTYLLHRMRPLVTNPTVLLYTAQSYANLVHTHNIFLYSDIAGGSTQDTNQEMPLLAVIPNNAPQLGVSIFEPKTNPLTKIPDALYEITISMKTDTGADYILPNSAPVNLEISLTY